MNYFEYIIHNFDPIFLIELLVAEAVMLFTHKRRKLFSVRLIASIAVCFLVAFLYPGIQNNIYLTILRFIILFILTVVGVLISFDCRFSEALFFCVGGYAMQHLAYCFYLSMFIFLIYEKHVLLTLLQLRFIEASVFLITYIICYFVFVRKVGNFKFSKKSIVFIVPSIALVLTSVIVNMYIATYNKFDFVINLYPIISCIIVLFLLFGVQSINELQEEKEKIDLIAKKDSEHYELYKANVDALNLKFHDLKYFLVALQNKNNESVEYIDGLKKSVAVYDSVARTGNDALDAILTEKKLACEGKKISFTYMVDGAMLNFLSPIDIYALLGNALDNAIESVEKVEEDLRVINMTVAKKDELLNIHIDNYFDGNLFLKDGLPRTTKADKDSHGFGMKSMRMIIEKYGGEMNISAEDNIFNLNIIFPL